MNQMQVLDKVSDYSKHLQTHQRRLRHLHSIAARNVHIPIKQFNTDVSLIELYFTLHKDADSNAFYTSEKIKGSLNPVWKSLNVMHCSSNVDTTSQHVTVRVWVCYAGGDCKLCINWDVHFSGLICLNSQSVGKFTMNLPNTLIFGIRDGLYGAAVDNAMTASNAVEQHSVMSDPNAFRPSYTVSSLNRVVMIMRAIKQSQSAVQRIRSSIDRWLAGQLYIDRKRAQRELAILKITLIREDLQWRALQIRAQKDSLEAQQLANLQKEVLLKNKWDKLAKHSDELREQKKRYFDIREELIKTGAQLVLRRKQLVSELALIYPIVQQPNSTDYTICGVRLPHSEDFDGQDEATLSVALGYTCHLVLMISSFLDIPLRYPMEHLGSRSTICDNIIDKISDGERSFPLFGKGKEKFQFHYGVYILNKNIAQLRYYCGMTTPDLRITLENISSLLCDRLGVAPNRNDAFSNQHAHIPPSFGGAQRSSTMPLLTTSTSPSKSNVHDTISVCSSDAPTELSDTSATFTQPNSAPPLPPHLDNITEEMQAVDRTSTLTANRTAAAAVTTSTSKHLDNLDDLGQGQAFDRSSSFGSLSVSHDAPPSTDDGDSASHYTLKQSCTSDVTVDFASAEDVISAAASENGHAPAAAAAVACVNNSGTLSDVVCPTAVQEMADAASFSEHLA